jgi:dolichol kinase
MTEIQEYKSELKRKSIHLLSTVIPVIYFYTSKDFIIWLVGIGLVLMIAIDVLKAHSSIISKFYRFFFHDILRNDEKEFSINYFTGGTYYAAGIFFSLLIFPMEVAICAILVLIWCDTMAALIGIKFGKIKLYRNKTLAGTSAFVVTGLVICLFLSFIFPGYGFIMAGIPALVFTALYELFNYKLNDNFTIPLFNGIIFILLKYII